MLINDKVIGYEIQMGFQIQGNCGLVTGEREEFRSQGFLGCAKYLSEKLEKSFGHRFRELILS